MSAEGSGSHDFRIFWKYFRCKILYPRNTMLIYTKTNRRVHSTFDGNVFKNYFPKNSDKKVNLNRDFRLKVDIGLISSLFGKTGQRTKRV